MALFPPVFMPVDPPAVTPANLPHWQDEGGGLLGDVAKRLRLWDAFRQHRLSPEQARRLLQGVIDAVKPVVTSITDSLIAGALRLGGWFRSFRNALIPGIFAGGMAILGTPDLPPVDAAALAYAANTQVQYLAKFRDAIANATVILDGTARARASLYAGSIWSTSMAVVRAKHTRDGFKYERNILGISDHCPGCLEETLKGWAPIGSLIPPGQRECVVNCRCTLVFRA